MERTLLSTTITKEEECIHLGFKVKFNYSALVGTASTKPTTVVATAEKIPEEGEGQDVGLLGAYPSRAIQITVRHGNHSVTYPETMDQVEATEIVAIMYNECITILNQEVQ